MGILTGKVAVVTGAGRGIGAAAAALFAMEGARLVISDLDVMQATETAEAIHRAHGEAIVVGGDVTDPEFPDHVLNAATDAFRGIDIIVNNAGYTWDGMIDRMSDAQWYAMLDVHATAPFRMLRAAFPRFSEAAVDEQMRNGQAVARKVINVSSISGLFGNPGQVNYATAKAGVLGLTKTLAKEWGSYNVQVNCVCYGFIETRLSAPRERATTIRRNDIEIPLGIPDDIRDTITSLIPLGRSGTVQEAAGPMLFLASPLSNYVTGHVLEVTGGYFG